MRQVARPVDALLARLLCLTMMGTLCSCVSSEEFLELKNEFAQYKQKTDTQLTQQGVELFMLRDESKKIVRNLSCADPEVANFVAEADRCKGGECPQKNLERVLGFMATQKHVLVRLRPNQTVSDMAPSRVAQLRDMLEIRQMTNLSRILMLTMQTNLGHEIPADHAEKQADATLLFIRRTLQLAPNAPHLGPLPVTCQNKAQLLDEYSRKFKADRVVPGEPKSKEPQVAIWIFKVDC